MITRLLFDSEVFECKAPLPMAEAIANLKAQVKDPSAPGTEGHAMVGSVSQHDVFIYCITNSRRNTFTPTFYGSFSGNESQSALSGTISINRFVKRFMLLWVGIVGLVAIATLITLIQNPGGSWVSFSYVLLMFAAAIGTLLYVKRQAGPAKATLKNSLLGAMENQS